MHDPRLGPQAPIPEAIWRECQEFSLRQVAPAEVSEEIEYRPVPPHRSITARVRYRLRGRGEPLSYPLKDE